MDLLADKTQNNNTLSSSASVPPYEIQPRSHFDVSKGDKKLHPMTSQRLQGQARVQHLSHTLLLPLPHNCEHISLNMGIQENAYT